MSITQTVHITWYAPKVIVAVGRAQDPAVADDSAAAENCFFNGVRDTLWVVFSCWIIWCSVPAALHCP